MKVSVKVVSLGGMSQTEGIAGVECSLKKKANNHILTMKIRSHSDLLLPQLSEEYSYFHMSTRLYI